MAPSSELSLAIRCCRAAFAQAEWDCVVPASKVDWGRFLHLVRFHRVQGLAWAALGTASDWLPADVSEALAADATAIAAENLRAAADCRALLGDFGEASVPVLFLKGLTVGALAYGSSSVKAAVDIDLLVAEDQVVEAAGLLEKLGYVMRIPNGDFTAERLRSWHRLRKESLWARPEPRSQIDLHTRLSDNRALIPSVGIHSPRQLVEVATGVSLPTLRTEELIAYLSVHGASSAWFRLKWISDFAGLLHGRAGDELRHLYGRSQELGAGRAAGQALLLADRLFGSLDANPDLSEELNRDPANRWLCNAAFRELAGKAEPREPTQRTFGTATIHLSQLGLLPGLRFKLGELARQVRAAF